MKEYCIIADEAQAEITEKKSRFIAHVIPVETEEEALSKIEALKKEYWDARHNCYAFVIGEMGEVQRFSDDGEPQGTAGKPILEVLLNQNIHNTLVVVTRYFGGTLLGTGGLVRAYGKATSEGIKNATTMVVCDGKKFDLKIDYNSVGKVKHVMVQLGIVNVEEDYGEDVVMHIHMKASDFETFESQVRDITSGKAEISNIEETPYKEKK